MITELKASIEGGEVVEKEYEVRDTVTVSFTDADGVDREYELPKSNVVSVARKLGESDV